MQLNTLRFGGSGARMAAVVALARGGYGLPRMVVEGCGARVSGASMLQ
jgi:hypothetical protein